MDDENGNYIEEPTDSDPEELDWGEEAELINALPADYRLRADARDIRLTQNANRLWDMRNQQQRLHERGLFNWNGPATNAARTMSLASARQHWNERNTYPPVPNWDQPIRLQHATDYLPGVYLARNDLAGFLTNMSNQRARWLRANLPLTSRFFNVPQDVLIHILEFLYPTKIH